MVGFTDTYMNTTTQNMIKLFQLTTLLRCDKALFKHFRAESKLALSTNTLIDFPKYPNASRHQL